MQARLWPNGLIGRVGLVLFVAIVLQLAASTFVFERAELVSSDDAQAKRIAAQLDAAARVLDTVQVSQRAAMVATLSEPDLRLSSGGTATGALPEPGPRAQLLREKLVAEEPDLAHRGLALGAIDLAGTVDGRLSLSDGSRLGFTAEAPEQALPSLFGQIASVALISGGVLLAALILVRTLAAPLRMLVEATDLIGVGPAVHLDDAHGPREIRRVAHAFNAMQGRIAKLLKDRTEALAAVSHDLRTPIARMQLRIDVGERTDAAAMQRDLDEMEAMLNDLSAYLRGETDPEPAKRTDVAAILQTLVDDATDAGKAATYQGPDRLTLTVRSLAMKRAVSNLVNNALAYGGRADVGLVAAPDHVAIIVEDDGPGIPDPELGAVLEPFYRGDASRNRAKGGMGLGLSIARAAVLREGGTIELANRTQGGLAVRITLPRGSQDTPEAR